VTDTTVQTTLVAAANAESQAAIAYQYAGSLMSQAAVSFQSGSFVGGIGCVGSALTDITTATSFEAQAFTAIGGILVI